MLLSKQDFLFETVAFKQSESRGDNSKELERLKKHLRDAIEKELTPVQKQVIFMYYYEKITIPEIAKIRGVNKSCISRILKRARQRLSAVLKYSV